MTHKQYNDLIREALTFPDAESFIAELGFPDWLYDIYGDDTDRLVSDLTNIYEVAHMSTKDIRKAAGMTQAKMCERFAVPRRTLEDWESGKGNCPAYTRLMIADLLGFIHVERNG